MSGGRSLQSGTLSKFQDELQKRYDGVIGALMTYQVRTVEKCQRDLQDLMGQYQSVIQDVETKRQAVFSAMETGRESFDALKENLEGYRSQVAAAAKKLQIDAIHVYDKAFKSMGPEIDAAREKCLLFEKQLPEYAVGRMDKEVSRLAANFLKNKEQLVTKLGSVALLAEEEGEKIEAAFTDRTDRFYENRFAVLLEDAKTRVKDPLDLTEVLTTFQEKVLPFERCFRKHIKDLSIITPPDEFTSENLAKWWEEVSETMGFFETFVTASMNDVAGWMQSLDKKGGDMMGELESEISTITVSQEISDSLTELQRMFADAQKIRSVVQEAIFDYWKSRVVVVKDAFNGAREFYAVLIDAVDQYKVSLVETKTRVKIELTELEETSKQRLEELELSLSQKTAEIEIMAAAPDIEMAVKSCVEILGKIADEYRAYAANATALWDSKPGQIIVHHATLEKAVLSQLKMMRRTESVAPKGSGRSGGQRSGRRSTKIKAHVEQAVVQFSVEVPGGIQIEEAEELRVLPPSAETCVETYMEKTCEPVVKAVNDRGRSPRGRKVPPSPRGRGGRGKGVEPVDESPTVDLRAALPTIDGKFGISLYIPAHEDIFEDVNILRRALLVFIYKMHLQESGEACHVVEHDDIALELSERLRMHSARAGKIEINVAQNRQFQLNSRDERLEHYYKKLAIDFNNYMGNMDSTLERMAVGLKVEAAEFDRFLKSLSSAQSRQELLDMKSELRITGDRFEARVEKQFQEQVNRMEEFVQTILVSNERLATSLSADVSEENAQKIRSSMERINTIVTAATEKRKANIADVQEKVLAVVRQIRADFTQGFPNDEEDIMFVEKVDELFHDVERGYHSLLRHNDRHGAELGNVVRRIEQTRVYDHFDAQEAISVHLKTIEAARIAIIKRARYLGGLEGDVSDDPIPIDLDIMLMEDVSSESAVMRPDSGEKGRGGRNSRQAARAPPKDQKKGPVRVVVTPGVTLVQQIQTASTEFTTKVTTAYTEYQVRAKARKVPVTRPDRIPNNVNELVEKERTKFNAMTRKQALMTETCVRQLLKTVYAMNTSLMLSVTFVFDTFFDAYKTETEDKESELRTAFVSAHDEMVQRRATNKSALNVRSTDPNNRAMFMKIMESEKEVEVLEERAITEFKTAVIEIEISQYKRFVHKLNALTSKLLTILDHTVHPEDVKCSRVDCVDTRTTKDKRKEAERCRRNPKTVLGRPFRERQWPTLPVLSAIVEAEAALSACFTTADASLMNTKDTPTRNKRAGKKTDKSPDRSGLVSHDPPIISIETILHRAVIIQRDLCFRRYETCLNSRMDCIHREYDSLTHDLTSFKAYWLACTTTLTASFPEPASDPVSAPTGSSSRPSRSSSKDVSSSRRSRSRSSKK